MTLDLNLGLHLPMSRGPKLTELLSQQLWAKRGRCVSPPEKRLRFPPPVSSERDAGSSRAQCLMGGPRGCRPEWSLGRLQDHQGGGAGGCPAQTACKPWPGLQCPDPHQRLNAEPKPGLAEPTFGPGKAPGAGNTPQAVAGVEGEAMGKL